MPYGHRRPLSIPAARAVALGAVTALVATLVTVLLPAGAAQAADPTPALQNAVSYASQNGYRSSVAVVDNENGRVWTAGDADSQYVTESLVKLFVATRLLVQGQMTGYNATTAYKMITQSDDAACNALYGRVGGDGVLPWVASHYGIANLGAPPPSPGYWGATRITARGLARFYYAVRWDPVVWPWLSNAMHHATEYGSDGFYQFFGIPSATSGFGVKQGWGSDTPTGVPEQNSTGVIDGDRFAVVILTQGPGYGGALSRMLTSEAQRVLPGGWFGANRYAVLGTDGTSLAKDGNPTSGWVTVASGARQVAVEGQRYAYVDGNGLLRVKEGALNAPWVVVAAGVEQVAMSGLRIAVLHTDGVVEVKEGALNAPWVVLTGGTRQLTIDGARIGVVGTDDVFRMKEGALNAPWVEIERGVKQASVYAFRVGVVMRGGVAEVKDGSLLAPWVVERTDATDLQVTRSRIGVVTTDNRLIVKDGDLYASWLTIATNIASARIRDDRVGVVGFDGVELVKQGFLTAPWFTFYRPGAAVAFG